MMNKELTRMNFEELNLVTGGELDIDFDRNDNMFTLAYKTAKSKAAKEVWNDIKGYASELGQRALGTAALYTAKTWETIKRWF